MFTKCLEVRDRLTFIPVLAIKLHSDNEWNAFLIERAGFDLKDPHILLVNLLDTSVAKDQYDWPSIHGRTMKTAHRFIQNNFDNLHNGEVIDVEFILSESDKKKKSMRYQNEQS